jgi:hypothetical protein
MSALCMEKKNGVKFMAFNWISVIPCLTLATTTVLPVIDLLLASAKEVK